MLKILLVSLIVVSFSFLFPLAFAQEAVPLVPQPSPSAVEYVLPYPGILPDHPLYIFKRLRDTLLLLLITKPIRKVEFYILRSDKQLNMSLTLVGNKPDLAVTTATQSVEDLVKAEELLFRIPVEKNSDVVNIKDRFEKSLLKHKEVIVSLKQSLTNSARSQKLDASLTSLENLYQEFLQKK